jgi:predicted secreted protein
MAGFNGRALTIDFNSTTLTGVRTRGFSISAEPVDVTTDDDTGQRTLLPDPGVRSIDVNVAGITTDEVLINEIMSGITGRTLQSCQINLATGTASGVTTPGTLSGDFFVSSIEHNGEHDGAVEFTAVLMSAGAVTYTATA